MPLTVDGHNSALSGLRGVATEVGLLEAATLTAQLASGASGVPTASLSRTVKENDYVAFYDGANREVFEIGAVSGGTANFADGKTTSRVYPANSPVGHAPKLGTDIVEPTGGAPAYSRQTMTWLAPANENLSLDSSAKPTFNVNGGKTIGGFLVADASNIYGTFLTNSIESFGSQGTYQLTDADVNLVS